MATTRPYLTIAEVLEMTEEDLRIECLRLEIIEPAAWIRVPSRGSSWDT